MGEFDAQPLASLLDLINAEYMGQYEQFVKPSFETFIGPSKSHADIVVPRGAENLVAIELIAQHINSLLIEREAAGVALEWDEHERSGGAIPEEEAVEQ